MKYRLPTDEEWSRAVGLTAEEGATPKERSEKNQAEFPWGTDFPPKGPIGNYADSTFHEKFGKGPWLEGYTDGMRRPHRVAASCPTPTVSAIWAATCGSGARIYMRMVRSTVCCGVLRGTATPVVMCCRLTGITAPPAFAISMIAASAASSLPHPPRRPSPNRALRSVKRSRHRLRACGRWSGS